MINGYLRGNFPAYFVFLTHKSFQLNQNIYYIPYSVIKIFLKPCKTSWYLLAYLNQSRELSDNPWLLDLI